MPAPSQTEVSQLRQTIQDLTKSVQEFKEEVSALSTQMLLHNAKQEPLELLVNKHEIQLNGDGKSVVGLLQTVNKINDTWTKFLGNIEKAVWIVVAAILTGVGVAVFEVFRNSVK